MNRRLLAALLVLTALSALLRLAPLPHVLTEAGPFLYDGDNYVHLRKILLHLEALPRAALHDPFEGYPVGTGPLWPPLLDQLFAVASWMVSGGMPDRATVERVAAVAPPLFGALTVLVVGLLGARRLGPGTGLAAAALLALLPAHIEVTVAGRFDYEMVEPLLLLLALWAYLALDGPGSASRRRLALAAALFLALLIWRGSTVLLGMIAALAIVEAAAPRIRPAGAAAHSAGAFAWLTLFLGLFCLLDPWGNQSGFRFNVLSWFHVAFSAAAALAIWACVRLVDHAERHGVSPLRLAGMTALLLGAGIAMITLVAPVRDGLLAGLGVVGIGRSDPWIDSIIQYGPLFGRDNPDPFAHVALFGWLLWVTPPLLVGLALLGWTRPSRTVWTLAVFTSIVLALTLVRLRFLHFLAVGVVLCAAVALAALHEFLARRTGNGRGAWIASACLLAAMLAPFVPRALALPARAPGLTPQGPVAGAMAWLRSETPPIAQPYRADHVPEYSVLARWDFAGWVEYLAERPVVATLYGTETFGMHEAARFFLATEPGETHRLMREVGARYVIISNVIGSLQMYARLLGRDDRGYVRLETTSGGTGAVYRPGPRYFDLVSTRLLLADGAARRLGTLRLGSVPGYRLVYESSESLNLLDFPVDVKKLKIYQRVPGLKLRLQGPPGTLVRIEGTVVTNRGRRFAWRWSSRLDEGGGAHVSLPYAVRPHSQATGLERGYRLATPHWQTELIVDEAELAGSERRVRVPGR